MDHKQKETIDWQKKSLELAKLLLEARDALPAITITRARLHNIRLRIDLKKYSCNPLVEKRLHEFKNGKR